MVTAPRKFWPWLWVALLLGWIVGCRGTESSPGTLFPPTPPPQGTLPPPQVLVTTAPEPEPTARAFFEAWTQENYQAMYQLLTQASRDAVDFEEFRQLVEHLWTEAALVDVEFTPLSLVIGSNQAQLQYRLVLTSAAVGEIVRETTMQLRLEEGTWRILWHPSLFLPELQPGLRLRLDLLMPLRGDIFDRTGLLLATQTQAYALGVIPSQLDPEQEPRLLNLLEEITGIPGDDLQERYRGENPPWYVPLAEVSAERVTPFLEGLQGFSGVVVRPYFGRLYFFGRDTVHPIGYVSPLQPDELTLYRRQGYSPAARIGRTGLERWGEEYLRGRSGGSLYVVDAQNPQQATALIASREPGLAASITSTLDVRLQDWVCFAIKDFVGAAVVLERDTGRVLALCSNPTFNPNAFEPENFNGQYERQALADDPRNPFLNRATLGQYPPGSTYKIITMAAALEAGVMDLEEIYECGYEFTELPGIVLTDWTLEYDLPPSGPLNIIEGLMRSCNPLFWNLGLRLFNRGVFEKMYEIARAFGLGQFTGIEIEEEEGFIPRGAQEPLDAVNQAIGQGQVLVTPLQMARLMAALGNGGRVLRPQLVERVEAADGTVLYQFEPEEVGRLPLSPITLAALRDGLYRVAHDPRGTAYHVFVNFDIPVYGKTGTAENPAGDPHAWFVAFTDYQDPERPDIALAVLLEHAGSGGNVAAPVARRILEVYFFGRPQRLYPWEIAIGETPTPEPTPTPTPLAPPTPTPGPPTPTPTSTPQGEAAP